jgi:hypothetical protein
LIEAALLFCGSVLLFRWNLLHWTGFLDFDGHYHLKVAQWAVLQGRPWTDIVWLPFTVYGERGPDTQWLWHLMLMPFVFIDDPAQALDWANACNAALTVAVLGFVMRHLGVPLAPLFALLAVTAGETITARLLMLRGQNIAVAFMALAVWAMARGRPKTLAVVAFLFMQSYNAAVILGPMALIGAAVRSFAQRRVELQLPIAVAAGLTLAMVVNPWFPRTFEFLMFHTLYATVSVRDGMILSLAGTEWFPPSWQTLLWESWPSHLTLAAAAAALAGRRYRDPAFRPPVDTQIALGVALMSLAFYFRAVRFAEYYVPFTALAAGLAARDCWTPVRLRAAAVTAALAAWLLVAANVGFAGTSRGVRLPADYLARVSQRLVELARPGEVVFNTSWSDYMALVWWAGGLRYVNGQHGHFLAYGDPTRLLIWLELGAGNVADPVTVIRGAFGSRFAVVARTNHKLAAQLLADPRAVLQVDSPEAWLFELRE